MIAHLLIVDGDLAGQSFNVEQEGMLSFGRSRENQVILPDLKLSKEHCKIENQGNQFILFDLDSRNGTYVNSERIIALPLKPGDEIQLGDTHIIFEISDSTEKSSTSKQCISPETFLQVKESLKQIYTEETCSQCKNVIPNMDFVLGQAKKIQGKNICSNCLDPYLDRVISHYKILEHVGIGGMGAVYKAIDETTQNIVAIKILHEYMTFDRKAIRRFLREAKLGSKLIHPNIVQFYDSGELEDTYFLVMEFVEGETLKNLIEQGHLGFQQILKIILQVAKVLELTVQQQIVHRDIKPENILVTQDGLTKLADLGVAKSLNESTIVQPTQDGLGIGSAYYMAPEQVFDAQNVTPSADFYGLGVTFYYALTKRFPFVAKNPQEYLAKLQSEEPISPRVYNPKIPDQISNLILKMIEKDPEKRIHDPLKLTAYLEKVLDLLEKKRQNNSS